MGKVRDDGAKKHGGLAPGYVSIDSLAKTTLLNKTEILELVRLYDIPRGESGSLPLALFLQKAIRHYQTTCRLPELVEVFEIEERQINQLAKVGKLPKVVRGIYPRIEAVRAYIRMLRNERDNARKGDESESEAKRRLTVAMAEQRELKLAEQKKQVVSINDVELLVSDAVNAVRSSLGQGIKFVVSELVGKDAQAIESILRQHSVKWMSDLADVPVKLQSGIKTNLPDVKKVVEKKVKKASKKKRK